MTEREAEELRDMAVALMPKSSEGQALLLEHTIMSFSVEHAEAVITDHATRSEFISVPLILGRLRAMSGNSGAVDRVNAAREASDRRRREEELQRRASDQALAAAREFCAGQPAEQLEAWRGEIVAANPFLGPLTAKRKILESPVLISSIYQRHGHQLTGAQ